MPNVVRFTLPTARELYVSGVGAFHAGVLDVDANDLDRVSRARYRTDPYGAVEVGIVDAATPPPLLPSAPVEPTPDPYPQYLTEVEVGEEYVRWDQIDPSAAEVVSTQPTTITDWNSAVVTGWYMANGGTNAPTAGVWFLGLVEAHNPLYVTQTVHRFTDDSESDTQTYRRSSYDAGGGARTWNPWYRLRLSEAEQNANLGTNNATGDTLVRRDGFGATAMAAVYLSSAPQFPDSATHKGYVDGIGSSDIASTNSIVRRDSSGIISGKRFYAEQGPASDIELTRKDYVDGIGTASPTTSTVVRRDSSGGFGAAYVYSQTSPGNPEDLTRKDYVDGKSRKVSEDIGTSRALVLADENKWLYSSTVVTLTVPPDSSVNFPLGAAIEVNQLSGTLTIAAGAGVTIMTGVSLTNPGQYKTYRLRKINPNTWHVALWS